MKVHSASAYYQHVYQTNYLTSYQANQKKKPKKKEERSDTLTISIEAKKLFQLSTKNR